jgi:hypothetical protein
MSAMFDEAVYDCLSDWACATGYSYDAHDENSRTSLLKISTLKVEVM